MKSLKRNNDMRQNMGLVCDTDNKKRV